MAMRDGNECEICLTLYTISFHYELFKIEGKIKVSFSILRQFLCPFCGILENSVGTVQIAHMSNLSCSYTVFKRLLYCVG